MKRAQSVEVLSVLSEVPQKRESVLPDTFFEPQSPPPSESPPPLPPREKPDIPPVHAVLNNTPALVNDSIIIAEKEAPPLLPLHPKPSSVTNAGVTKPKQPSNAKKPTQKRPSAGVLFGIKEKELPAPDTVRETRKLFEANAGGGGRRYSGRSGGGLTKSKSTSSLYTRPASRSNSVEKTSGGISRKNSEEDLHRTALTQNASRTVSGSPVRRNSSKSFRSSSPRNTYRTHTSSPNRRSHYSPGRSSTSSPNRDIRTRSPQHRTGSKSISSPAVPARPVIPAKPSHLSPIVNGRGPSYNSNILDKHVNKVTPTSAVTSLPDKPSFPSHKHAISSPGDTGGLVKASLANVVPSDKTSAKGAKVTNGVNKDVDSRPVHLKLHPIIPHVEQTQDDSNNDEEGIKRISQASIQNIRNDGNVVNFIFDDKSANVKSYLPGSNPPDSKNSLPKQVGVIRPISRDSDVINKTTDLMSQCDLKPTVRDTFSEKKNKASPAHVSNLNKINNNKTIERESPKHQKETLIIEKDPVFVPVENWKENTQNKKPHSKKIHSEKHKETNSSSVISTHVTPIPVERTNPPSVTSNHSSKSPPSVPPRNGSKLEHIGSPPKRQVHQKYFDSNIEANVSPSNHDKSDIIAVKEDNSNVHAVNGDVTDKSGGGNSYRDSWKARNDQQNTLVFNFTNSKKDVSHIENDGLDLSKRKKQANKGVILLDTNGESCDADVSDTEEAVEGRSSSFTFVGAEIRTGKSSIRSKQKAKKLNISFNDKTEVFEYPSFESVNSATGQEEFPADTSEKENEEAPHNKQQNIFKANTAVGSSGGLGSYTPSKIQMIEAPFQLGVSRTPVTPSAPVSTPSIPQNNDTALLPADHGLSWGNAASSDMLF